MTEADELFELRLRAIFAEEARAHLAGLDAGLVALAHAGAPARAALAAPMLVTLHSLKGAARSVELGDLEWMCHALEGVLARAAQCAQFPAPQQFDLLYRAVVLARQLLDKPTGRARNEALALIRQLDVLASELADPLSRQAP